MSKFERLLLIMDKQNNRKISCFWGRFPLGGITDDFAAKYIWAYPLVLANSLSGEIFLFKIVKINSTKWRRKKSPQSLDQSKHIFLALQQTHFHQIQSEMAASNLRNIHVFHVSVNVLSTLLPLQQGNLYYLQQQTFFIKVLNLDQLLAHFMPLVSFDTPWKHQKTKGFPMFSGGIESDQWHEMG